MMQLVGHDHEGYTVYGGTATMFNEPSELGSSEIKLWQAVIVTFAKDADDLRRKVQEQRTIINDETVEPILREIAFDRSKVFIFKMRSLENEMRTDWFNFMCDNAEIEAEEFRRRMKLIMKGTIDLSHLRRGRKPRLTSVG